MTSLPVPSPELDQVARWADSGAMALTGRPDGPGLGPPSGLVPGLDAVAARLERATAALGAPVTVDPLALLVERATALGLERGGTTSCGGHTRLLPAADGWIAVALARSDDRDLLPAWLDVEPEPDDVWPSVERAVADRAAAELVDRGRLLGLPVAALPHAFWPGSVAPGGHEIGPEPVPRTPMADLLVVDLGSLWAGPLCGALLAQAGARVVKVEAAGRPDGARVGSPAFFDRLNGAKEHLVLDLPDAHAVADLRRLLATADVVIEASRPRALEQLGIDARELVAADDGPRVWASITAHGRTGDAAGWVGFGDDAAVAGGLVVWDDDGPCFCADAIADPVTGLVAATAVAEALAAGQRRLLDLPMSGIAGRFTGPTLPAP